MRIQATVFILAASLAGCANLDERGNAALGGAVGGAAGAVIGHEAGGRQGAVIGAGAGAATGAAVGMKNSRSGEPRPVVVVNERGPGAGHAGVRVPPGHMPPPGKCRVWFPERPPGQQPPVGNCHELRYRVPHGAVLIGG